MCLALCPSRPCCLFEHVTQLIPPKGLLNTPLLDAAPNGRAQGLPPTVPDEAAPKAALEACPGAAWGAVWSGGAKLRPARALAMDGTSL